MGEKCRNGVPISKSSAEERSFWLSSSRAFQEDISVSCQGIGETNDLLIIHSGTIPGPFTAKYRFSPLGYNDSESPTETLLYNEACNSIN
jgi:hypothetical protein